MDRNIFVTIAKLCLTVALRKESVDRNTIPALGDTQVCARRSPQGERG